MSDAPDPCAAGLLHTPMPGLDDPEGPRVPEGLPTVIDGHVHLFPDAVFDKIWAWFDQWGWPVRYKLYSQAILDFQLSRGVSHVVALHYAHRPGLAREMNRFMAEVTADPRVTGMATVYPGEPDAVSILEEGFALGLRGVKLHCHVQCVAPDDPRLAEVYDTCVAHDLPLVMHAGREPKSPGYRCDPHALCHVDRVEAVLRGWPTLRLCVPHLGVDEFIGYQALLEQHDNLWLDTTMVLGNYFETRPPASLIRVRPERILFGTDFPNIPYAWDRELKALRDLGLDDDALISIAGGTARALYGV